MIGDQGRDPATFLYSAPRQFGSLTLAGVPRGWLSERTDPARAVRQRHQSRWSHHLGPSRHPRARPVRLNTDRCSAIGTFQGILN